MSSKTEIGYMKMTIDTSWRHNWSMYLFVFITIFYTFFISLCNRISSGCVLPIVVACITLLVLLLKHEIRAYTYDVIVFTFIFIVCLLNCLLFNVEFNSYVNTFLFCFIPMIIAGGAINFEKYKNFIYKTSCVYICFLLVYMVTTYTKISTVSSDYIDYLGFAYYIIPAILFVIHKYFESRSKLSVIFSALGLFYLLICGTRGPMFCVFIYCVYCVLNDLNVGSTKRKLLIIVAMVVALILCFNLRDIAEFLYPVFQRNGFSTRFFLFFMQELDITDLSGRNTISTMVIQGIKQNPIWGAGLMADRNVFGGSASVAGYSHNLVLEVVLSFGIPLGGLMLLGLLFLIIRSYSVTTSKIYKDYIVIYFIAAVVKLFFSSSFMQESPLFLLIGICFGALRRRETGR